MVVKKANELAKPVFNQQLIDEMDKDIKYLINEKVVGYRTSAVCYEYEDIYQECLTHLWEATIKYNPNRDMKFRTYAIMRIRCRLANFVKTVSIKNKLKVKSMSELEGNGQNNWTVEEHMDYLYQNKRSNDRALDEILDLKMIIEQYDKNIANAMNKVRTQMKMNIKGQGFQVSINQTYKKQKAHIARLKARKIVFIEYCLKQKKPSEIYASYPHLKNGNMRHHINHAKQVYQTFLRSEAQHRKKNVTFAS